MRRTRPWAAVFAGLLALVSGIYLSTPLGGMIGVLLSWALLPGVAVYDLLNGSVLFGAGFGGAGDFAVIALGSAAAWALFLRGLFALVARLGTSRPR